jgi:hypothetical protein
MPRVELAVGHVSVMIDAPRVALSTVHALALEALAYTAEIGRMSPRQTVGFGVGSYETELAVTLDLPGVHHNPPTTHGKPPS